MLQAQICGYLGADAQTKNENGKEFTTFRVAHSDRWTGADGQTHESTQWIDVILNGRPAVTDYLKAGTLVYCSGHCKLRCYSSEKARGFVAGMTISAIIIELIGGKGDTIPNRLYDAGGVMHNVTKYYWCDAPGQVLTNGRGKEYAVDDNGWILPLEQAQAQINQQQAQAQAQAQAQQQAQAQAQTTNPQSPTTPTSPTIFK